MSNETEKWIKVGVNLLTAMVPVFTAMAGNRR